MLTLPLSHWYQFKGATKESAGRQAGRNVTHRSLLQGVEFDVRSILQRWAIISPPFYLERFYLNSPVQSNQMHFNIESELTPL